jgi:hypothetical protein
MNGNKKNQLEGVSCDFIEGHEGKFTAFNLRNYPDCGDCSCYRTEYAIVAARPRLPKVVLRTTSRTLVVHGPSPLELLFSPLASV